MLKILAFAKLNLYLRVVGKLPDGYHSIETVMQTVTLSDELQILPTHSKGILFTCSDRSLEKQDNLVCKACDLFFKTTGLSGGFHIHLQKRIPVAAGLGGGSSDAAAALSALNHLYHSPLKISELEKISLCLGADVPFFVRGGCALAEGKGERLTPIAKQMHFYYVIVKQGNKSSTGDMYAVLDQKQAAKAPPIDYKRLVNDAEYFSAAAQNDFSNVCPVHAQICCDFHAAGAEQILLSGSGPSCFAVFKDRISAYTAYVQLQKKYPAVFLAADTANGSLIV